MATEQKTIKCYACGNLLTGDKYYKRWIKAHCDACNLTMYSINEGRKECDKCGKVYSGRGGYFENPFIGDICLSCIKKEYQLRKQLTKLKE